MIVGIGVDAVEIARIQRCCEKEHFIKRIFTEAEIQQFDKNKTRAASDFAGKEAVAKIFGTGFSGCQPGDIEILRDGRGAPYVRLYRGAEKLAAELGIEKIHISITNTAELAIAYAIGSNEQEE